MNFLMFKVFYFEILCLFINPLCEFYQLSKECIKFLFTLKYICHRFIYLFE